jgi:hypothetical protein
MLANLRRKVGMITEKNTPVPTMPPPPIPENMVVSSTFGDPDTGQSPFTMEELGFAWPNERGIFSPSAIPVWLQEQVSIFINLHLRLNTEFWFIWIELDRPRFARQWFRRDIPKNEWGKWLVRGLCAHARSVVI